VFFDITFLFTSRPLGGKTLCVKLPGHSATGLIEVSCGLREQGYTNNERKTMIQQTSKIIALVAIGGLVAGLAGCSKVCHQNELKGVPLILCQPIDRTIQVDTDAELSVEAVGNIVSYHWFFNNGGTNDLELASSSDPKLRIPKFADSNVGSYWCELETTNRWGQPTLTRTRTALMGTRSLISNALESVTIESQPFRRVSTAACSCARKGCGFVVFYNDDAGYRASSNVCTTTLVLPSGTQILNTDYGLMWVDENWNQGCLTNVPEKPYMKTTTDFTNKIVYVFSAYFTNGCLANNAPVQIRVKFQAPVQ